MTETELPSSDDPPDAGAMARDALVRAHEILAAHGPEEAEPYVRLAERLARTAKTMSGLPADDDEENSAPGEALAELEARLDRLREVAGEDD